VLILTNIRGVNYVHLVLAICSVSCWVGCKRIVIVSVALVVSWSLFVVVAVMVVAMVVAMLLIVAVI